MTTPAPMPDHVPEGDIVIGDRPQPGARDKREPWNGSEPEKRPRTKKRPRILGIDAARGFAVIGMVAVHTMPAWNDGVREVSMTYEIFAGRSAQLFALLAGLSLAIISGMSKIHTGRRLRRDRWNVFFRVVFMIILGGVINLAPIPVYNILPYYAFFFLFAIPFLGLGARSLFLLSFVTAIVGPLLRYFAIATFDFEFLNRPDIIDMLYAQPLTSLSSLIFTGVYPAITWMAYIFLGMAIGRLDLRNLSVVIKLGFYSLVTAVTFGFISDIVMQNRAMYEITEATDSMSYDDVWELVQFGGRLPSSTLWWQFVVGPHTNTIASVFFAGALAAVAVSAFLVLERAVVHLLEPLIAVGSMSLTVYVAHMLFLYFFKPAVNDFPVVMTVVQIVVAVVFAVFWKAAVGQGPLEKMQAVITKSAARRVVPERPEEFATQPRRVEDIAKKAASHRE
ncbi:heparan-alpha-glucosaminide N-acetyltransferase domain-containing protein [Corynebacterium breve]|uniref:Heparan-alpha-glucosaminide N-acetyltransferase domain-containing protein n=1 Tax=Corynebacterium breve TaxID=3049799 RepID=A0ABY8VFX8_9CORY|nr:acyltransferase family protein [Corynebacterium breve]WIM68002.1 heparan-alpha-glucosaminide N-acetyltransferase domain-containing protein [Corynebacterium breve]